MTAQRSSRAAAALLGDDRYARVAQRVAAEMRELPPVATAIAQFEDLAGAPGITC